MKPLERDITRLRKGNTDLFGYFERHNCDDCGAESVIGIDATGAGNNLHLCRVHLQDRIDKETGFASKLLAAIVLEHIELAYIVRTARNGP
ncbi:MAG TPA: hypothetical protein VN577_08990 [Terriglobales bacterium]|nr:hypothetical protein [Terriglobales bacterium]